MSFTILIKNNGRTSTIKVTQRVGLNERKEIYNNIISEGETDNATAFGNPPSKFDWEHLDSSLTGSEDVSIDGGTLEVND